jgi:hypothetical protein
MTGREKRLLDAALAIGNARVIAEQIGRADERIEAAIRRENEAKNAIVDAVHELRNAEIARKLLPQKAPDIDALCNALDAIEAECS